MHGPFYHRILISLFIIHFIINCLSKFYQRFISSNTHPFSTIKYSSLFIIKYSFKCLSSNIYHQFLSSNYYHAIFIQFPSSNIYHQISFINILSNVSHQFPLSIFINKYERELLSISILINFIIHIIINSHTNLLSISSTVRNERIEVLCLIFIPDQ